MTTYSTILEQCRSLGLRKTRALVDVVTVLSDASDPVTLNDLAAHPQLKGRYNDATLYRLITRLEEHGLVQRLGMHTRAAYYVLRVPGVHRDYLVCTHCGCIVTLNFDCPVHALENEIAEEHGFQSLYHELQFYGTCPRCTQEGKGTPDGG